MPALYGNDNYGAGVYGQDSTYTLIGGEGAGVLTGKPAGLLWKHVLAATRGTGSLVGETAGLLAGHVLAAVEGAYALTGKAASRAVAMAAQTGIFGWDGQSGDLFRGNIWLPAASNLRAWTTQDDDDNSWTPVPGNTIYWTQI